MLQANVLGNGFLSSEVLTVVGVIDQQKRIYVVDQHEVDEREWNTKANWRFGVYNAPLDSRIWVPKPRKWMGWTLNFAHRVAYFWLAALLLPAHFVLGICIAASLSR